MHEAQATAGLPPIDNVTLRNRLHRVLPQRRIGYHHVVDADDLGIARRVAGLPPNTDLGLQTFPPPVPPVASPAEMILSGDPRVSIDVLARAMVKKMLAAGLRPYRRPAVYYKIMSHSVLLDNGQRVVPVSSLPAIMRLFGLAGGDYLPVAPKPLQEKNNDR
ncbi:hypothetical protein [Rhodopila sp.]|uniref:hypothetical protein n=1 Tax=Rhodopila sp. TaxID=2480087 RepID=UPI003D10F5DF